MADNAPEHYEKMLKGKPDPGQVSDSIKEIEDILAKMKKGLDIMEKVGKKPEKKVLENKQRFEACLQQLKALR